jgi:hypothetical protein
MLGSMLLWRLLAGIVPGNSSPALWVWLAAPLVLAGAVAICERASGAARVDRESGHHHARG